RPDPAFGSGGIVTTHTGVGDFIDAMAAQPDGKIVTVGVLASSFTGSADIALLRYLPSGELDRTFGRSGKVITDLGRLEFPQEVLRQRDGRLVVAGFSTSSNGFQDADFQAVRYLGSADVTPPVVIGVPVREPDGNGYYRSPVRIKWMTTDDSGTASHPPDTLVATEGAVTYESAPSCDASGNCAIGRLTLHLDLTDPTVTCAAASFTLNEPDAVVLATVADEVSGPVSATLTARADTTRVGSNVAWVTGEDRAGRQTTVGCPYTVRYRFSGFYAPVDNPPAVNDVTAGQVVPVRWRLTDYVGRAVADPASFIQVTTVGGPCDDGTSGIAVEGSRRSASLRTSGAGSWAFNWATPSAYAGHCRVMALELADGSVWTATFAFR
ncbi:MAG: delta-60 repeat domain-containing protein, partial [Chloroflexota bacterium]|nr:delta-60 repeat domain-containing protein [Chloroflexota bacterium]